MELAHSEKWRIILDLDHPDIALFKNHIKAFIFTPGVLSYIDVFYEFLNEQYHQGNVPEIENEDD